MSVSNVGGQRLTWGTGRDCVPHSQGSFLEDSVEFRLCSILISAILLSEKPISSVHSMTLHLQSTASTNASCQHRVWVPRLGVHPLGHLTCILCKWLEPRKPGLALGFSSREQWNTVNKLNSGNQSSFQAKKMAKADLADSSELQTNWGNWAWRFEKLAVSCKLCT